MSKAGHSWDGFLEDRVRPLSPEEHTFFRGKRVLITGGGGYLGSALARALAGLGLEQLVLLDTAEYGLYRLEQDLAQDLVHHPAPFHRPALTYLLGSVGDSRLLQQLFTRHAPEIVFHTAALKHVPLLETNALAAAETNILGTQALVHQALRHATASFVFLSTDKAVVPSSLMGATKRVAEQIVLSEHRRGRTALRVARLCNVLGSTGSVAPLFARQALAGGPLTVTDAEATRYFLSTVDAVRFLLRAACTPAPTGLIAPNAGAPRRIEDLARFLLQQLAANRPVPITHTGLRPADKLHEQLVAPAETLVPHPDTAAFLQINSAWDEALLDPALADMRLALTSRNTAALIRAIRRAVPEYVPAASKQLHLVQRNA